ncbi:MAG: hypothetical protein K2L28_03980, partial [Muribaculaceae bacterium]|nr:hypothetical protein [Muribaculaceae bacterium]
MAIVENHKFFHINIIKAVRNTTVGFFRNQYCKDGGTHRPIIDVFVRSGQKNLKADKIRPRIVVITKGRKPLRFVLPYIFRFCVSTG